MEVFSNPPWGLLAAPAGAAQRLTARPFRALWLSAVIAVGSMWAGLSLAYVISAVPPSFGILGVATVIYLGTFVWTGLAGRRHPPAPARVRPGTGREVAGAR